MADTVYDAFLGAYNLRQCFNGSYNPQAQVIGGIVSGAPDPSALYGHTTAPKAMFQTGDLAGLIAGVSMGAGLSIASGTVLIPFRRRANQGTHASGSSHVVVSGTDGLAVCTEIAAAQDDEAARAGVDFFFRSTDGLTNPAAIAGSQSLSAQAFVGLYAFGPVYVNGSKVGEVIRSRVVPGITVQVLRHDGGNYPDRLYIVQRRPVIELTFRDFDDLAAFGTSFAVLTSVAAYYRKRSGAGFVSDASTSHVKCSFTDSLLTVSQAGANDVQPGEATIQIHGLALTASAASAIP